MSSEIETHDITKPRQNCPAPGRPGVKAAWSTGAKTAVGTAVTSESRVWFTLSHGYLNEIYFPDVDRANTRYLRFLVSGEGFVSDEGGDVDHHVSVHAPGVPAFHVSSRCKQGFYSIDKQIVTDPGRDALLVRVKFQPHKQSLRLYLFCDPHVRDEGENNSAWIGEYKGVPMLFASRDGLALAIACSAPFKIASCGFLGVSDPLTEVRKTGKLTSSYTTAEHGNVGVGAEINYQDCGSDFTTVLAYGGTPAEAGLQARAALLQDFDNVQKQYITGWSDFQKTVCDLGDPFRISAAVLRTHQSKQYPGAFIASLSIPWGFDRSDKDTGGYHVIWPRDMCETALALLGAGDSESARRALFYLQCTQDADGHWGQNMWLDGTRHWTSRQMDETAFPVLLADALYRANELTDDVWPMLKRTAAYLVQHGPVAEEDRWESNSGYATFTMAVEIAALLMLADFADLRSESSAAQFLRETADAWNDAVDELTYVAGTDLARQHGASGYYLRLMPPEAISAPDLAELTLMLRNHPKGEQTRRAVDVVSPDALALVRYGLRAPDDPRILDTVKVIDATLKTTTATGPAWHRYTYDGYGEQDDGTPFRKKGVGRGWPLLAGERAHYEIARGNFEAAQELRRTIESQTSECGLIPEQIWDAPDIPEHQLFNGRPTGSGMPLVWAHAEYMKLVLSLRDGRLWNIPPQTVERYIKARRTAPFQIWTPEQKRTRLQTGKDLRIDLFHSATVRWTADCWKTERTLKTKDSGLGLHWVLINTSHLKAGEQVRFRVGDEQDFELLVV